MNTVIVDAKHYKDQRDRLRKRFEDEKTGEQAELTENIKLFRPIIESQNNTSKAIQDKLVNTRDAIVPFTRELQKRIDQMETLQGLPYYDKPLEIQNVPQSTPQKDVRYLDLDGELINETHRENLQDMSLDLPSVVESRGTVLETYKEIEVLNRTIGQYLGKASKKTEQEKAVYQSQKHTLLIYTEKLKSIESGQKLLKKKSGEGIKKLCRRKLKRGRPKRYPDAIFYNNPDELIAKLEEFVSAKAAGNTGVDNYIVSILDELREIGAIDQDRYNILMKNILLSDI
jgi:hypothetical protein